MPPEDAAKTELLVEKPAAQPDEEVDVSKASPADDDPGKMEGVKREPKEHEPPPDSPRFKEIYGKWKSAERQVEDLTKLTESFREHNEKLSDKIAGMHDRAQATVEKVVEAGKKPEVDEMAAKMEELEAAREQALDPLNFDAAAVNKLDKEIRKLDREMLKRDLAKPKEPDKTKKSEPDPMEDPGVKWFLEEAKWYKEDPVMAGAANALDAALYQDPAWQSKPTKERLAEVKRQVEERFNKGNGGEPKKEPSKPGATLVEPAEASPGPGKPKTVKLTQEQMRVAHNLGIKPEDYAAQLAFIEGQ